VTDIPWVSVDVILDALKFNGVAHDNLPWFVPVHHRRDLVL
jgi:hypothetical protein